MGSRFQETRGESAIHKESPTAECVAALLVAQFRQWRGPPPSGTARGERRPRPPLAPPALKELDLLRCAAFSNHRAARLRDGSTNATALPRAPVGTGVATAHCTGSEQGR